MAGFPYAAPIAAPLAAPSTVPTAAPLTAALLDACCVVVPVCSAAHSRHSSSSTLNCSKSLPVPGNTITLGPAGNVAHPARSNPGISKQYQDLGISILAVFLPGLGSRFPRRPGPSSLFSKLSCAEEVARDLKRIPDGKLRVRPRITAEELQASAGSAASEPACVERPGTTANEE